MKTDRYTKTMLTVIAICLVILVFKGTGIVQSTYAYEPSKSNQKDINYGMIPINPDGSINVHLKSDPAEQDVIDVRIKSCSGTAFSLAEPISVKASSEGTQDVKITSCSPNAFYQAEPIEVKIHE